MTLKALFQDLRCWIWVLWLASWPDKDYLNCSVHQSSSITLNSSSLSRIAGRGWAFPNTQLIVTLKIASLIISPGGPFPAYGREQGTFEIISHLMPLTICFVLADADGWRSKRSKWLCRPQLVQSWTKPWSQPDYLCISPLQSFLRSDADLWALSSPSQTSAPAAPFFPAIVRKAYTFMALLPEFHLTVTMLLSAHVLRMRTKELLVPEAQGTRLCDFPKQYPRVLNIYIYRLFRTVREFLC